METNNRFFLAGIILLFALAGSLVVIGAGQKREAQRKFADHLLEDCFATVSNAISRRTQEALALADFAQWHLPANRAFFDQSLEVLPGGKFLSALVIRDQNGQKLHAWQYQQSGESCLETDCLFPTHELGGRAEVLYLNGSWGNPLMAVRTRLAANSSLCLYFSEEIFAVDHLLPELQARGLKIVLTQKSNLVLVSSFKQRLEGLPLSTVFQQIANQGSLDISTGSSGRQRFLMVTNVLKRKTVETEAVWGELAFPGETLKLYLFVPRPILTSRIEQSLPASLLVCVLVLAILSFFLIFNRRFRRTQSELAQLPGLKAELAHLSETSLRYSTLLNSMIDGILLLDLDGKILDCNRSFAEMLGYSVQDLIGSNQRALTPPKFWQIESETVFNQVANWGFNRDYEKEFIRRDGSTVPVIINSSLIKDSEPGRGSILSTLRDISEQKRTSDEIKRLNSLLEDIIESSTLAIMTLDGRMRIRTINSAATGLFKLKREVALNQGLLTVIPFFKTLEEHFEQAVAENKPLFLGNQVVRFSEDEERHINLTIYPLRYHEAGSLAIHLEDISEQVYLERSLSRVQKMEALGTLASGFAHDFNNLLSGIFSYLTVIKLKTEDQEILEPLELVYSIARRASTLVKQILSFSRSRQNQTIHIDLLAMVREVFSMIKESFPKNITLENQLPLGDEDPEEGYWIMGDPSQIAQVLLNLCINARDAMPEGGRLSLSGKKLLISEEESKRFRHISPGEMICLTISDTGVGVDPEIADKIFDPFFTTKEDRNGTGMGLFIVYGILRSHHGDIELSSSPGKGTSFDLYLPSTRPPAKPQEVGVEETRPEPSLVPKGELLIIDDEEIIRSALSEGFSRMGFNVRTAESGVEGIARCRERLPDLVILDMIMPGIGGEEAFDILKAEFPALKIVIHTGFTQVDIEERMLAKGALDVLHKPYEMVEVTNKLARWIRS